MSLVYIFLLILFVWLVIISFFIYRLNSHYQNLTSGVSKLGLRDILEKILLQENKNSAEINSIVDKIDELKLSNLSSLSKVGIVRFNPFSDTGGSQSFSLAIMDGQKNGIIVTSLYARTGNRWYIKEIKEGLSKQVELSKEEQLAIKRAMDRNKNV